MTKLNPKSSPIGNPNSLFFENKSREKPTSRRELKFENLEERCVLSGNSLEFAVAPEPAESALVSAESTPDQDLLQTAVMAQTDITSITVLVNGQAQTLNPSNDVLNLTVGDEVEVTDIQFDSTASDGVFAVEGYINKIRDDSSASLIDYNDGRFSLIADNFSANSEPGSVEGLAGTWTVETGWDRLTLSLLHYQESQTSIASRAIIQLQVGQADFAFDEAALANLSEKAGVVGEQFDIYGAWKNLGSGNFHNYAEVDIYHSSNTEEIVWAGALVGNASSGNSIEGLFLNNRTDDSFAESFTPEQSGTYIFRFYLDPEGIVTESNELNNTFDVKINIEESNTAPVANNDSFSSSVNETLDRIDALANDLDSDQDEIQVAEFTQAENGTVQLNADGTFSYTPDENFSGVDEFSYAVTDGNSLSETAIVQIEVLPNDFQVEAQANGNEDTAIALKVEASADQFTHVRISNVPSDTVLSHGKQVSEGNFDVSVDDLEGLTVTPGLNSDTDFDLAVTPFNDNAAYVHLTETISVNVEAVADGGRIRVANFGILEGTSGRLPFAAQFLDTDQSEINTVTFHNLPDFISFSVGKRDGSSWVVDANDLQNLKITAGKIDDVSDFNSARGYYYRRFDIRATVTSVETSNGDSVESYADFALYALKKRT